MSGKTIDQMEIGETAQIASTLTADLVAAFVTSTSCGERIAPGMLTATLVAAVIGSELPGAGCAYLSQTLKFLRPVKLGDTITARVEVVETLRDRNRVRLRTECANGAGELVLVGEAWVMPAATAQARSVEGEAALPLALAA